MLHPGKVLCLCQERNDLMAQGLKHWEKQELPGSAIGLQISPLQRKGGVMHTEDCYCGHMFEQTGTAILVAI